MEIKRISTVLLIAGAVVLVSAVRPLGAATLSEASIGKIKVAVGDVSVMRGGARLGAKVGDALVEHDILQTGQDGSVGVTFTDQTSMSTGPNSHVAIDTYLFNPTSAKGKLLAEIKRGSVMVRSGKMIKAEPGAIKIRTPRTMLTVRGTTFLVEILED